ncbi:MAG: AAA family ATPase [Candidatus Micrarchaeaceae archaeon]
MADIKIICITGYPCSGKSTAAEILKSKGFTVIELGDLVREQMAKDPEALKFFGDIREFSKFIRERYGKSVVADWAIKKILADEKSGYAITGIRTVEEYDRIRSLLKHTVLVAIEAPERLRFERMVNRARPGDPRTYEAFLERDEKEREGLLPAGEEAYGLDVLIRKADYKIENNGTIEALSERIGAILRSIG